MPAKNFPNYPDMLKFFYRHNFPMDLGAPATSVALAIIYKSNELIWPPDFKMSNLELSHLSGESLTNIWRTRQKVLDRCKVGGVPLFSYVSNGKRRSGTYIINFNLTSTKLQTNFKLTSTNSQKAPEIDQDHNIIKPNDNKTTTTEEVVAVNFQSEEQEKESGYTLQPLTNDIIQIKGMVFGKYKAYINAAPSDGECMRALEGFSVEQLIEAGDRAPDYPKTFGDKKNRTPGTALGIVVSYAKNPSWGGERYENGPVKVEETQEKTKIEKLEYWIKYCSDLPNRYDEIYPCMEKLADLTGESVDEIFARCEFLLGTLDKYVKQT